MDFLILFASYVFIVQNIRMAAAQTEIELVEKFGFHSSVISIKGQRNVHPATQQNTAPSSVCNGLTFHQRNGNERRPHKQNKYIVFCNQVCHFLGSNSKEIMNLNMSAKARIPIINVHKGTGLGPIQFTSIIELPFARCVASFVIIMTFSVSFLLLCFRATFCFVLFFFFFFFHLRSHLNYLYIFIFSLLTTLTGHIFSVPLCLSAHIMLLVLHLDDSVGVKSSSNHPLMQFNKAGQFRLF